MKSLRISIGAAAFIAIALLITGCSAKSESTVQTSNSNVKVEKLFEHEGCTAYRFDDQRTVHYVRCTGQPITSTSENVSCGKNCTREQNTVTLDPPSQAFP